MKLKLLLMFFTFFIAPSLMASESVKKINFYKLVEAQDKRIHLIADLEKKTITITKLKVNHDLPIGNVKLKFQKTYSVKIKKAEVTKHGKVIISGSDYFDGIGTNITLSFFTSHKNATVKIQSHFEETALFFHPQLLELKIN